MARLQIDGLDQLMADYTRRGQNIRPIIAEALSAGGAVLREEILAEEQKFKAPTGELGEKLADRTYFSASAAVIEVYYEGGYYGPRGGGEKKGGHAPRRAAFVAATQEYKNQNPFNRRAMTRSKKRINSIIAERLSSLGGT